MAIATLTVDFVARMAKLEQGFTRVEQLSAKSARSIEQAFGAAGGAVKGLIGGAVAALSVGQLTSFAKGVIDAADRLDELAERTQTSVEFLNGMDHAMQLAGGTSEQLEKGLQNLNKKISEVSAGNKAATELFGSLGVNAKDAEGALMQLADVFPRLSKADQVRIGNELLGKSYETMVPLLAQGRDGLRAIIEEGQRLNPVTAEMAKQSAEFNDNMDKLARATRGAAIVFLKDLVPALNDVVVFSQRVTKEWGALAGIFVGLGGGSALRLVGVELNELKRAESEVQELFTKRAETLKRIQDLDQTASSAVYGVTREAARNEAEELRADLAGITKDLNTAIKQRNALQEQARTGGKPKLEPPPDLPSLAGAAKVDKLDPNAGFDTTAAQAYARAIERLAGINIDAATSSQDLTKAQRALLELQMSPEWARMPEAWKAVAVAQAETASASELAAEKAQRLNAILAGGPAAQLERRRDDMLLLAESLERGAISAEQFKDAAAGALDLVAEKTVDTTDTMQEFAKQAARNMQDAFADFLFDPFDGGVEGMLESFGTMLQRMIAEAVAADLAKRIFGNVGGGEGDGWLGAILDGAALLMSANGNAFAGAGQVQAFASGGAFGDGAILTSPTLFRFAQGGTWRAGVAGEAGPEGALPLKRMSNGKLGVWAGGGGGQSINVTQYISVPPGANTADVKRAAGAGAREALAALSSARRYQ